MLFDCLLELKAGEELQQLREDARKSLHGRASLGDCVLVKTNLTQVCTGRALLIPTASRRPNRQFSEKLFWTRVMLLRKSQASSLVESLRSVVRSVRVETRVLL